ncbi:MAG: hypothetical protein AB7Q00_08750 [Phycisphaerales bacterium]
MTWVTRLLVFVACLATLAWFGWNTYTARVQAKAARADLLKVASLVREVGERRATLDGTTPVQLDPASLIPALHEALLASSLPTQTLASFASDGSTTDTRARATLEPITLPQLGTLLDHWRASHPTWTATTIELGQSTARGPSRTLAPGTDPIDIPSTLRVGLILEPTRPSPQATTPTTRPKDPTP